MPDFLTTGELAKLLRVKERKIYDLVAKGAVPVHRVTGKLLFEKTEIDGWIACGGEGAEPSPTPVVRPPTGARPAVCVGSHDPLLEWALRESRSGIAAFLDGALDGIARAREGSCIAAGLHIPEPGGWNAGTVATELAGEPWVLIEFAKRARGLVIRKGLAGAPANLRQARVLRFQGRQPESGSELVLTELLEREGLTRSDLPLVNGIERSETDLAMAISTGRADVGLGISAAARQFGLDFVPLIVERFDLLVWRHAYFEPPMQRLMAFCNGNAFAERAATFGGYDIGGFGAVQFNGAG